jgi:curved DNA-binding protein CbpA
MTARTHYEVLMVHPRADRDIIGTVYRRLAKRYHPDRDPSTEARQRMVELNEAYEVLGDPGRRARYDAELEARAGQTPSRQPDVPMPAAREPRTYERARMRADAPANAPGTAARTTSAPSWGEAGRPPAGPTSGAVLDFGRYRGWTLAQVARVDRDFLEWLRRTPAGRAYRAELDALLAPRRP